MARKKAVTQNINKYSDFNINDSLFFGLNLDENQKTFRNAIWNEKNKIIFCDAPAGTGKTTIALATARLLISAGKYDGVTYLYSVPNSNSSNGFIPGTIEDKEKPYFDRICSILIMLNEMPEKAIKQLNPIGQKPSEDAWIDCRSHIYLRGSTIGDFDRQIVIIDESQNFYIDELKKSLTRVTNKDKTIVIGHSGQCDLLNNPERSGFVPYMKHYAKKDWCQVCELTKNYRGEVSKWADKLSI